MLQFMGLQRVGQDWATELNNLAGASPLPLDMGNLLAAAPVPTFLQHNHSSQSKGLWGAEMRQDREQKNVIYKASADWNLSSDPLAAAQLICS